MTRPTKGLTEFVGEATELVEALAKDALVLDERRGSEPDPELVNGLFRAAHTLKGLSGMFGQDRISALAHGAEELLDGLRLGKAEADDEVLDALVECVDLLQALLGEAARGEETHELTERAEGLSGRLTGLSSQAPAGPADELDRVELDAQIRSVLTEYEEHRLRENVRRGVPLWKVRAVFDLDDFDQGLARLNAKIKSLGELISTLPSAQPGDGNRLAFDLVVGSRARPSELEAGVESLGAALTALPARAGAEAFAPKPAKRKRTGTKPKSAPAKAPAPVAALPIAPLPRVVPAPALEQSLRSLTQTVRVDIGRLDSLMNAVGELLLIKANLTRLAEVAVQGGAHAVSKLVGHELGREARRLERKLDELQTGILDVRMVPLGQVFDKLARLVRRIVREAGKEIDFALSGGDVELDKLIVEELSDPLMHLLRNAIDHGIEGAEERERAGKQRRGRISLRARQQGSHVVITVADDGNGLNEARIREVALQKQLVAPDQLAQLDRRELQNLIFLPGFSTARVVSQLSGRGVGLDVVKTNVARLSGIIDVDSDPGGGTTFTLTLPATLAIIRALVVTVSGQTYAVPLNSVLEILSVTPADIRTVERREVVSLRGHTVPFVRLARVFRLPEQAVRRHFVVVVGLAQERLGIAVDDLEGQQDIVIKPLGGRLRSISGIAGATDMGNRRTVLVLDVGVLIEEVLRREARPSARPG